MPYIKALFLNIGVLFNILLVAFLAIFIDKTLGIPSFQSNTFYVIGASITVCGFLLRFWASVTFYKNDVEVLSLKAQKRLITNGPFAYSRNPLYIGITLIFTGVVIFLGSYIGVLFSFVSVLIWDWWLKYYEEKNLKSIFGEKYSRYITQVPRWIGIRKINN